MGVTGTCTELGGNGGLVCSLVWPVLPVVSTAEGLPARLTATRPQGHCSFSFLIGIFLTLCRLPIVKARYLMKTLPIFE